jgi:hypothetical protein
MRPARRPPYDGIPTRSRERPRTARSNGHDATSHTTHARLFNVSIFYALHGEHFLGKKLKRCGFCFLQALRLAGGAESGVKKFYTDGVNESGDVPEARADMVWREKCLLVVEGGSAVQGKGAAWIPRVHLIRPGHRFRGRAAAARVDRTGCEAPKGGWKEGDVTGEACRKQPRPPFG